MLCIDDEPPSPGSIGGERSPLRCTVFQIMNVSTSTYRRIGGAIVVLGLIGVGLYMWGNGPSGGESDALAPSQQDLELVSHEGRRREDGSLLVTGVVRNTSRRTYGQVTVDISLYDETDAEVGATSVATRDLAPGEEWRFEAPLSHDGVARYEIDRVTWQ